MYADEVGSSAYRAGKQEYPGVAQLVARVVWDHEAAGSNPVTRTMKKEGTVGSPLFSCFKGRVEPAASCHTIHGREAVDAQRRRPQVRTLSLGPMTRETPAGGLPCHFMGQGSNHVRTCRGHVHETVRTLSNTIISFPRLTQAEKKCKRTLSLRP